MKKYTKYKPKNLIDDQLFKFVFSHETLAKQLIDTLSKYISIDWDFSKVEFFTYDEGLCVQCMHIGPYDNEPETLEKMKDHVHQTMSHLNPSLNI